MNDESIVYVQYQCMPTLQDMEFKQFAAMVAGWIAVISTLLLLGYVYHTKKTIVEQRAHWDKTSVRATDYTVFLQFTK